MKKWTILMMLLAILLTGCTRLDQQTPGTPRVVTGIEASFDGENLRLHRIYSDSEKLQGVLTYLRCLDLHGTPDPEEPIPQTNSARIVITFSDGSTKVYEQQADQFLRQDGGPWQRIDPDQAREFALLLKLMESDEIS